MDDKHNELPEAAHAASEVDDKWFPEPFSGATFLYVAIIVVTMALAFILF